MNQSAKRKIEVLANEQFKGDICSAIVHIFKNYQDFDCDDYYDEFTDYEKNIVLNIIPQIAIDHFGEDVFKTDRNHYCQEMKKIILPEGYFSDSILTKDIVWNKILNNKFLLRDNAFKLGKLLTALIYIFATLFSLAEKNVLILLYPIPIVAVLFLFCYLIRIYGIKAIEKEQKKEFDLIRAVCTSITKSHNISEASVDKYVVCFNDYINYYDYNHIPTTQVGESYYLASIDGEVKAVFPASKWRLDSELNDILKFKDE